MTKQKHLKERVRARMLKTGESYTAARRRVLAGRPEAEAHADGYRLLGGTHPDTAALTNSLANAGVTAGGKPLSEELILGIGGGLGAGYILWQFTGHDPIVTLGFRNQWQYPDRWLIKTCRRLGIEPTVHETSGHVTAMRTLREALSADGPRPLAWIDVQEIGYWQLPERFSGMGGYPVVIIEERDGRFLIDDRNSAPVSVDEATLRAARGRVSSYRNRLVTLSPPGDIPSSVLVEAIQAGFEDQVRHLESDSDSFSLPAWRKWARLVTDTKHKKGWGSAFAGQHGLFSVLLTIYESIESSGFGGGSLRGLYASFLDTAADLIDRPSLSRVSGAYRGLDKQWADLAERVAPSDVEPFSSARDLIDSLHEQVLDGGDTERPAALMTAKELWRLRDARNGGSLFDPEKFEGFLQELGDEINALYEAERDAVAELGAAIKT
jgi:Butirosin biosynthesis protein H, N-terminal/Domain of unknown function (DUF4872)